MSTATVIYPTRFHRPTCVAAQTGWLRRWRLRRTLARELLPQPDSVLADAGWTRAALRAEVAKPIWR